MYKKTERALCYNNIMADRYQKLLIEWCDALLQAQITDRADEHFGGFRCESCGFPHGRADNAIYPFVSAYALTGEGKYLVAAENLLVFRKKLAAPSGAMRNDFSSGWEGITAFSAIGLLKTLLYFGEIVPLGLKNKIEKCALGSARWVHRHMVIGFPAYINYYCAAALTNALYAKLYHDEAYRARAEELLRYCNGLFTENGLLAGEGKPHDDRSPKGCPPIDIGYIAEESMPCLIHAAELLGEEEEISFLTENALKLLDFLLPDGGWDNSFGVRNNKWTYYGSRTSDGCIGAFSALAKRNEIFADAAERTYRVLMRCTHHGKLYGGMRYFENGQKPCIHHTFCHAAALADALREGISERAASASLPAGEYSAGFKYYPELNTYKVRVGPYRATLTGYDYATHHFANGAAHAGGGALSLLYKEGVGAMIAGSVYEYRQTEPNNMQAPAQGVKHSSLIVRAEYEKDGVKYATCLDKDPEMTLCVEEGAVLARVRAKFCSVDGNAAKEGAVRAEFHYRFAPSGVTIKVNKINAPVKFILPVVEGSGKVLTESPFEKERIFFLPGGFSAEEYAFPLGEEVTVTII